MAGLAPSGMLHFHGVVVPYPTGACTGLLLWYHTVFVFLLVYRYRYDWKREEAEKYILRTHTTAVSARMLYEVANVKC